MNIDKKALEKKPRTRLIDIANEVGYESGKRDGYNEGWDEGYSKGKDDGHEEGYSRGAGVFDTMAPEQLDVLIKAMARLLGNNGNVQDQFVLLRTMSEVNAKNMLNPDYAWHINNKTLPKKGGGA